MRPITLIVTALFTITAAGCQSSSERFVTYFPQENDSTDREERITPCSLTGESVAVAIVELTSDASWVEATCDADRKVAAHGEIEAKVVEEISGSLPENLTVGYEFFYTLIDKHEPGTQYLLSLRESGGLYVVVNNVRVSLTNRGEAAVESAPNPIDLPTELGALRSEVRAAAGQSSCSGRLHRATLSDSEFDDAITVSCEPSTMTPGGGMPDLSDEDDTD